MLGVGSSVKSLTELEARTSRLLSAIQVNIELVNFALHMRGPSAACSAWVGGRGSKDSEGFWIRICCAVIEQA